MTGEVQTLTGEARGRALYRPRAVKVPQVFAAEVPQVLDCRPTLSPCVRDQEFRGLEDQGFRGLGIKG